MTKREKISFANLENVFTRRHTKDYTDAELLGVIKDPHALAVLDKAGQVRILAAIARQMEASEEFKIRALEEFEKSLRRNKR